MPAARVIEAIDVFEDSNLGSPSRLPGMPPDQLRLDGFEEGLHRSIIIAISLAAHGHFEAMQAQQLLIIVRTVLTAPVRMVDAALRWTTQSYGHF